MSYILDALQRADAERGRGSVPGLHARQLPGSADAPASADSRLARPLVWGMLAGLVLAAAAAAGLWMWRSPAPPPSGPVAAAPATLNLHMPATTPAPVGNPTPTPAAAPVAPPNAPPAPMASAVQPLQPPPVAPVAAPAPRSAPAPAALPVPATATATVPVTANAAGGNGNGNARPAPTAPTTSPAEPPLLSELPDDLRRQIPALAITGAVHADNPAQRLLVVNNQVLTQDGQLGPDLVLETIGSRHSVFRFRGTRFRVANQ